MFKGALLILATSACLSLGAAEIEHAPSVIYGTDDRYDILDSDNPLFVKLAKSTAARIEKNQITIDGLDAILRFESLMESEGVCSSEKFATQNSIADCSGFLIAKDLLVTAGHCVTKQEDCDAFYWAFDYQEGEVVDNKLPSSSIYSCKKIIKQRFDIFTDADYAVIQLDRKVKDRKPLKFRKRGEVKNGDKLVVIGHPSGLPTKIAESGEVVQNDAGEYFVTNLDTFGGNSGSAVFNTTSGVVEGIMVRGARDYIYDYEQGCYVANVCENVGGVDCDGEEVTRITTVGLKKFTGISGFFKRLFGKL